MAGLRVLVVSALLLLPFFGWSCTRIVKSAQFDNACDNHMQEAFAATNLESNIDYMVAQSDIAKQYLERHNITHGYTSIFFQGKEDNMEVYYNDVVRRNNYFHMLQKTPVMTLTSPLHDLEEFAEMRNNSSSSSDSSKQRTYVVPDGISIFPHNTLFFWWFVASVFLGAFGILGIIVFFEEKNR